MCNLACNELFIDSPSMFRAQAVRYLGFETLAGEPLRMHVVRTANSVYGCVRACGCTLLFDWRVPMSLCVMNRGLHADLKLLEMTA